MSSTKLRKTKAAKTSAKDKRLLSAKERVLKIKRDVLQIVELLLEDNISEEFFLESCAKLCKQDYADVIEERSIEHVCGYPLCNKTIKMISKQYQISTTTNKVYDITERKCFCCNECYKASNYIKAQLADLPLYMRKSEAETKSFSVLNNSENKGSAGEEVVLNLSINEDDVEGPAEDINLPSNNLSNILQEDVKGCKEHLANLTITENVYEKPYVFGPKTQDGTAEGDDGASSKSSNEDDSEEDEEQNLFPNYDDVSVLSTKQMPVSKGTKKTVLISPLKSTNPSESPSIKLSIEFVNGVFQDWFTEDTMRYLLGDRMVYSLKADMLLQTMISSDIAPSSEKMASIKKDYIELCLKIDKLQEDHISDSDEDGIADLSFSSRNNETVSDTLCIESNSTRPIPIRKPRSKGKKVEERKSEVKKDEETKSKVKKVSFVEESMRKEPKIETSDIVGQPDASNALPEPVFPLVDSISQNALRKQVLIGRLKAVYFDILPVIRLRYRDIRDGLNKIVETFSLTPSNITFKPKEWKCIALVLFRILSRTTLKDLEDDEYFDFPKLCDSTMKQLNISTSEIEELVSELISKNQVHKLQASYNIGSK